MHARTTRDSISPTLEDGLVSIMIPTLNSEITLGDCLKSVRSQTFEKLEIIVVDSFSSDSSKSIAEEFGARVLFDRGLLKQRVKSIYGCHGEFALLLDSDQTLNPNTVEACVDLARNRKFGAIIIPERSVPRHDTRLGRISAEYMRVAQEDRDPIWGTGLPRFFSTGILRAALEGLAQAPDVGYFDHALIYQKVVDVGATIGVLDFVGIEHHENQSVGLIVRKFARYYGGGLKGYFQAAHNNAIRRVLPRRILFRREILNKPKLWLSLVLFYCLKVSAAMMGIVGGRFRIVHREGPNTSVRTGESQLTDGGTTAETDP